MLISSDTVFNVILFISVGVKSKPTPRDLSNKVLPHVCSMANMLAIQLGLNNEFKIIEKDYPQDVERQTMEVFCKWEEKDENFTWEFLIQALRSPAMKLYKLATDVEDWLRCKN